MRLGFRGRGDFFCGGGGGGGEVGAYFRTFTVYGHASRNKSNSVLANLV